MNRSLVDSLTKDTKQFCKSFLLAFWLFNVLEMNGKYKVEKKANKIKYSTVVVALC